MNECRHYACFSYVAWWCTFGISIATQGKLFKSTHPGVTFGDMQLDPDSNTGTKCSLRCLKSDVCDGFMFNEVKAVSRRCQHIIRSNNFFYLSLWNGQKYFADSGCANLNVGITTPPGWSSGCPKKYFQLNAKEDIPPSSFHCSGGHKLFLPGGKVGNYMSIKEKYYTLKTFPLDEYCFPDPIRCPLGVTYAFWLDIVAENDPDPISGFFTTMRKNGPGISVYWKPSGGLFIDIRRGSDNYTETVNIARAEFLAHFGFQSWVHYPSVAHC